MYFTLLIVIINGVNNLIFCTGNNYIFYFFLQELKHIEVFFLILLEIILGLLKNN